MAILKSARCPQVENLVKAGWVCPVCQYAEESSAPVYCPKCLAQVEVNFGFQKPPVEAETHKELAIPADETPPEVPHS